MIGISVVILERLYRVQVEKCAERYMHLSTLLDTAFLILKNASVNSLGTVP
jgi:hypothetical protein